jgi:transposase-like protein
VRSGRAFWKELVAELDGGERVAEVARRHRVQPRTLSWWRWKLRSEGSIDARLLPVVVRPAARVVPVPIELQVRDLIIRVACDTDVAYVAALVDALRG